MEHLHFDAETDGVTNFVWQYTLASGGPYCDCGYEKKGHKIHERQRTAI